jgi:aarF domain-containing kinase
MLPSSARRAAELARHSPVRCARRRGLRWRRERGSGSLVGLGGALVEAVGLAAPPGALRAAGAAGAALALALAVASARDAGALPALAPALKTPGDGTVEVGELLALAEASKGVPTGASALLDARRGLRLVGAFVQLSAIYKVEAVRAWALGLDDAGTRAESLERAHARGAGVVLELCRANGGLLIKLGQHACSLRGAVPETYVTTLRVLQDAAPARPLAQVARVLAEELGPRALREAVACVDARPVGCASLAQVHRCRTVDGRELALKVQHADVASLLESDVVLLAALDRCAGALFPGFSLGWALREFEQHVRQELDFSREAAHLARARELLLADSRTRGRVFAPRPEPRLCSARVVAMDFVRGTPVGDVAALRAAGLDTRRVAAAVRDAFAAMIFSHGFVHCDPHPGNMLVVRRDDGSPAVALLDHGLYRELPERFRAANCRLWCAMVLRDADAADAACRDMGIEPRLWRLVPFVLVNQAFLGGGGGGQGGGAAGPATASAELGRAPSKEQAREVRKRAGLPPGVTLRDLEQLATQLPPDFLFVLKACHLVKDLNDALGGTNRARFLGYARFAAQGARQAAKGAPPEGALDSALATAAWGTFMARFLAGELAQGRRPADVATSAWAALQGTEDDLTTPRDAPGATATLSSIVGETLAAARP